jgi:hypothetical protein
MVISALDMLANESTTCMVSSALEYALQLGLRSHCRPCNCSYDFHGLQCTMIISSKHKFAELGYLVLALLCRLDLWSTKRGIEPAKTNSTKIRKRKVPKDSSSIG